MLVSLVMLDARRLAWLPLALIAGGCAAQVVEHDRPCAANPSYEDFRLDAEDPPSRLEALRGVTEVVGDVYLEGSLDSLEPLACLSRVHGRLTVTRSSLRTLDGLERLQQVGGLSLTKLSALIDTDALAGLERVDDGLVLTHLPKVEDLSSLSGVRELAGDISMYDVAPPAEFGLVLGEAFAGQLQLEGELPDLRATTAGLKRLSGDIHLHGAAIARVDLRSLEFVGGQLGITAGAPFSVTDDSTPATLPELTALREVAGPMTLLGLAMSDLSGLSALESVGDLSVRDCGALESLHGLEGLRAVISSVPVGEAPTSGGGVSLSDNEALVDLRALGSVSEMVSSSGTPGLLTVSGSPKLASLEGVAPLVERAWLSSFGDLPVLEDLQGLSGLASLGGLVLDNTGVQTLEGLSLAPDAQFGPQSMHIELRDNAELLDIAPLVPQPGHAVPAEGIIFVERSPLLSGCQAQALIDAARDRGFAGDVVQQGLLDDGPC